MSKTSSTLPVAVDTSKHLQAYHAMSTAIAACLRIDECKDIVEKSSAMAAYHEQIRDTETERMFYQVKLRAWRRIGELLSAVDTSDCETQKIKIQKIRDSFDEAVISEFSDSRIYTLLNLMTVPEASFEIALKKVTRGGIDHLMRLTPEHAAKVKAWEAQQQENLREQQRRLASPEHKKKMREEAKKQRQEAEQQQMEQRNVNELLAASATALKEVGITLDRKDRIRMKSVVFLIRDEVHAVMRQAAFDQKITMQEVLRRGLKMWLIAHDYDFPDATAKKTAPNRREQQPNA